jgi:hypothetical protein
LNAPKGVEVDHINRDPLDNRRVNLRLCTHSQNGANKLAPENASGYRGVYKVSKNRWHARKKIDGKCVYLGSFTSPKDAAERFDAVSLARHGKFAVLNEA